MIPQIIARDADEMKVLMDKMLPMGYYPQRRLFVLALFWQLSQLCLNHHVAIQRNVEEKQIDEFLLSAYLQAVFLISISNLNYLVMNKIFNFMNNKNKWSIIINALLTALTGILTAYGIL